MNASDSNKQGRFVENQWVKVKGNNDRCGRRHCQVLENFRSLERRSFSLFVDNLPNSANTEWLWEIFSREGEVVDVFLSKKVGKYSSFHFAFVRFAYKNHALRAANKFNGWELEGVQLLVTEAKYEKDKRDNGLTQTQSNWSYHVRQNQVEVKAKRDMGETKDQPIHEVVKEEVNVELVEMLKRSFIGESILPLNREDIIPRLYKEWETLQEVKEMGPFKMNFHKIAAVLGIVVDIENVSSIGTNYSSVKANIVTSWHRPIHKCVVLELNEVLFEVFIAEISEERKYKCKIEDDVMLMKEVGDSKISGPNDVEVLPCEEVAGNCEKSNSTRCIVDDRRLEKLIKDAQMASSLGRNMKRPIQYNLEVERSDVEPSSNPQFPPSFKNFNTEKTKLNQLDEVQNLEKSNQGTSKYAPEKKGETDRRRIGIKK
ncbi:hypothetical protein PIB30_003290 [Stylosanthes scabra]|uniref:RRM domain-containing protein n=1 Tax=Stylosanthes scabra TaxID=79078 RepID=A0ABU6S3V0_9FABA|nr:hypothetical protein [Stylosanthes scabra]